MQRLEAEKLKPERKLKPNRTSVMRPTPSGNGKENDVVAGLPHYRKPSRAHLRKVRQRRKQTYTKERGAGHPPRHSANQPSRWAATNSSSARCGYMR